MGCSEFFTYSSDNYKEYSVNLEVGSFFSGVISVQGNFGVRGIARV